MTTVVNLWGGPGTGKSSTASDLFALMKWEGESVELITEFAKELTWDGHFDLLADQLWVSANQNRRMQRLKGKVNYIITDSPLLLCEIYAGDYFASFHQMIHDIHSSFDNVEVFLNRKKQYVAAGRSQDEQAARTIDQNIRQLFFSKSKNFDLTVDGNDQAKYAIYEYLKNKRA